MKERLQQLRAIRTNESEGGFALLMTVFVMVALFMLIAIVAASISSASQTTATRKNTTQQYNGAESGVDSAVFYAVTGLCVEQESNDYASYEFQVYRTANEEAPKSLAEPGLYPGCPQDGDRYLVVVSNGYDDKGRSREIFATYMWVENDPDAAEGAVVIGNGGLKSSSLAVYGSDAALIIGSGNFDCNNASTYESNVYVLQGTTTLSGSCVIKGDVYSRGGVTISNSVVIEGDVLTLSNFSMTSGGSVEGNVTAAGSAALSSNAHVGGSLTSRNATSAFQMDNSVIEGNLFTAGRLQMTNNARVNGSVFSASNDSAQLYSVTVGGDLSVNGYFSQLQSSSVGGTVSAVARTMYSSIAPGTTIGGDLRLGGNVSTWGAGPTVTGSKLYNQTLPAIPAPVIETPLELEPDFFTWRDYDFNQSVWEHSGYDYVDLNLCNFQNNISLVNQVNNATKRTVFDIRGCTAPQLFGVTFEVQTDIVLLTDGFSNSNEITLASGDGERHQFVFLTPDTVKNGAATCSSGQSAMNLYGLTMAPEIETFAYTPCALRFGGPSVVNGQLYGGTADFAGGGTTRVNYHAVVPVDFPQRETEAVPAPFDSNAMTRAMPELVYRAG